MVARLKLKGIDGPAPMPPYFRHLCHCLRNVLLERSHGSPTIVVFMLYLAYTITCMMMVATIFTCHLEIQKPVVVSECHGYHNTMPPKIFFPMGEGGASLFRKKVSVAPESRGATLS